MIAAGPPDVPPPASDAEAGRVDRLRAVLCGATLVMVALSWPLWIDLPHFPAVPFVRWFPDYPRAWSWLGLALILTGLVLGITRRFGRIGLGLTILVMIWLVLGDQLRLQPWVYQFLVLGSLILALRPRSALVFSRVWMASIYLHSGLSKIDVAFAREIGPLFVRTLGRVLGVGGLPFFASPARLEVASMLMPAGEIVVAFLLLMPRTRRVGYLGVVLIHASLILVLGPWGLGHSTIVLVWNVAVAVEESFLFWPRLAPGADPFRWDLRETLVAIPLGLLLVLPFGERAGLLDSWPSHALYAGHCEGTTIVFRGDLPRGLPDDLRIAAVKLTSDTWTLNPTDWSRRVRGVPVYPQIRYTNGLAEWIAGRIQAAAPVDLSVVHRLRADLRTGDVGTLSVRDLKEAGELSEQFWFNAHPRDRSGR